MPWTAAAGRAFGGDWLLAAIAPASVFGRRSRARESAFRPGDEAAAARALERVVSAADACPPPQLAALSGVLAAAPDPGPALARARGGGVLGDPDFFELGRFLDAYAEAARLGRSLVDGLDVESPTPALARALALGLTRTRGFYLDDAYAPALAQARAESARRQAAYDTARSRLAERAAAFAGEEHLRDGEFTLMRDRLTSALPPEIRIVREAATYLLCELALDAPALAALAARDAAAEAVAAAEEAVRVGLSEIVAQASPALERACDALGELDALAARAHFTQRFACVLPEIGTGAAVTFDAARYLPLEERLAEHGRRYTPLALDLRGVGVVTGPNMGGKTAALRTLGFVVACVALGVPVPARAASVALVDDIAWLGLEAAPGDDAVLSAFGREVVALRALLGRPAGRALVLVDEFARTTSPREGRALLVAFVERLRDDGALALASTHLTGIAATAGVAHYAVGGLGPLAAPSGAPLELEPALARIAAAMDYGLQRVAEDAVPAADAVALAEALGLDAALIGRVRAVL